MDIALALAMLIGVADISDQSGHIDRRRFPPDAVLQIWARQNSEYTVAIIKAQEGLDLGTMRPGYREEVRAYLNSELEESRRIGRIIWEISAPNSNQPEFVMRAWMLRGKDQMTPEEYASGILPWGGIPVPGWRTRLAPK
jgi:hypothetical protein